MLEIFKADALSKTTILETEIQLLKKPAPMVDEEFSSLLNLVSAIRITIGNLSPLKASKIWILSTESLDLGIIRSMLNMGDIFVQSHIDNEKLLARCFSQCVLLSKKCSPYATIEFYIETMQTGKHKPDFKAILKKQENELSRCAKQLESFNGKQTGTSDLTLLREKFDFLVRELEEKIKRTKRNMDLL